MTLKLILIILISPLFNMCKILYTERQYFQNITYNEKTLLGKYIGKIDKKILVHHLFVFIAVFSLDI